MSLADGAMLKLEIAKLQKDISSLTETVNALQSKIDKAGPMLEVKKQQLIASMRKSFEVAKSSRAGNIEKACTDLQQRVIDLIDSFPGAEAREYAGRYEVKSLEAKLKELYPSDLVEKYVALRAIEFDSEGEAYRTYLSVEKKIASLHQAGLVSAIFSGITKGLVSATRLGNAGGRVALLVILAVTATFVTSPFIFLTLFSFCGVVAAVQGFYMYTILRKLYSIKMFLNESYDEDIFNDQKADILDAVNEFIVGVKSDYLADLDSVEFHPSQAAIKNLEDAVQRDIQNISAQLSIKKQELLSAQSKMASLLEEQQRVEEQRKKLVAEAQIKYLETVDWEYKWNSDILLDVVDGERIKRCIFNQGNTLYLSSSKEDLLRFEQLVVYQNMLRMHPLYACQIVLDYKYMGGLLVPLSRVNPNVLSLSFEKSVIEKKTEEISKAVRDRTMNILQSCESLDAFNELMASYNAVGENYVIVHLCGFPSVSVELQDFLRNGNKVGYFFKLYLTIEEFKSIAADFPYEDVEEYATVGGTYVPRTAEQVKRMMQSDTQNPKQRA